MNRRRVLLLVFVLTSALALGGALLTQAAQAPAGSDPSPGAGYRLDVGSWQASGVLSGAGYRLEAPAASGGTGTPCCCLYLPCTLR